MEYAIFYNPNSCGGNGFKIAKKIEALMGEHTYNYYDILENIPLNDIISSLPKEANVILTGGDGTLNSFVNQIDDFESRNFYFYASGSGNDFMRDIGAKKECKPVLINEYIKNLPTANIGGKTYKFLNGVGSGMDGYCCAEVERVKKISKRRGNYLFAAIKALLYAYKPCDAYVIADGKEYVFKNTWLVPTMNGRFFGGGFMAAPNQNRSNSERTLSLVAMHSKNFFKIIVAFLLIMKGKHTKLKSMIKVIEGHEFSIRLSKKAYLQIDGETIPDVTEYTVSSAKATVKQ